MPRGLFSWSLSALAGCAALLALGAEPALAQTVLAQAWPWGQPNPPTQQQYQYPYQYEQPRPQPRREPRFVPPPRKVETPKPETPSAPVADKPPPPYEPALLRLSEILGALTYLRDICGAADSESWRGRMQALLDAEAKGTNRKEHLAGAYNRGFHGYELSYRVCTPNARIVIKRFLAEGEKIAHEIANRYGSS